MPYDTPHPSIGMPFNQPCPSHAAANRAVEPATGLSYRDTEQSAAGPNFHPLIQQKRLVTGQRKGDVPQAVSAGRRALHAECRGRPCLAAAVPLGAQACDCGRAFVCNVCLAGGPLPPCLLNHLHPQAPRRLSNLTLGAHPCCNCPQIKQYRGLPFKVKARGIFNATGLNEGIVLVSRLESDGCAHQSLHSLVDSELAGYLPACLPASLLPQGSNLDVNKQPTQYESSLERPITTIFTGALRWCGWQCGSLVGSAGVLATPYCPSSCAQYMLQCATKHALHLNLPASVHFPTPHRQPRAREQGGGLPVHPDRRLVPGLRPGAVRGVERCDRL